jgi:hypothetical protein
VKIRETPALHQTQCGASVRGKKLPIALERETTQLSKCTYNSLIGFFAKPSFILFICGETKN